MAKAAAGKKTAAPKAAKPAAKPKTPKAKVTPGTPALAPATALPRSTTRSKFTLYNLLGQPRAYYLVEPEELPRDAKKGTGKSVAHSIIVVDRSGSMYSALAATKETLLKVL